MPCIPLHNVPYRPISTLTSLRCSVASSLQAPSSNSGRWLHTASWHSLATSHSALLAKTCSVRQLRRQHAAGRRGLAAVCSLKGTNRELVVGDCLALLCFCLYKQISAIVFLPTFPGWLAPLAFNPVRFVEFASFAGTVIGTWVGCGLVVGGFDYSCTADLPTALSRVSRMWLAAMPVSAAQLVLLTAAEDGSLVGTDGYLHSFASVLPLAASGPGEPFVTAGGVLGLMAIWRCWYATTLDFFSWRTALGSRVDRARDAAHFQEALRSAALLSLLFCLLLVVLGTVVGEERLEMLVQQLG